MKTQDPSWAFQERCPPPNHDAGRSGGSLRFIRCSRRALKRMLSTPLLRAEFSDSPLSDGSLTSLRWESLPSGSSERCPEGPRGTEGPGTWVRNAESLPGRHHLSGVWSEEEWAKQGSRGRAFQQRRQAVSIAPAMAATHHARSSYCHYIGRPPPNMHTLNNLFF